MTSPDHELALRLYAELMTLTEPLHEALATAALDADKHLPAYRNAGNMSFLRSGIMRLGVREHLHTAGVEGWTLHGNPNLMGQLQFVNSDRDLVLLFLKDGRPPTPAVPHAGHNQARRAFWRNTPMLDLGIYSLFDTPAVHKLLLLWSPGPDGTFNVRTVRPLEPGRYSGRMAIDFSMELAPTRTAFEELKFVGEDHDEDLMIDIDGDEESDNASGAAR
ncbi:hypothetical protein J2790_000113 [Paenarthrobacter nicotinovorans]|uniref:hypothetical protein n=1 Tax=Micrococcaceae TaxID=1268 RepID=UPI000876526D|nr:MULTISPECIES: hypothetical protein [Micrococcaceae]MDR6434992.1 hypothetical protein [Paenarthrobacter nicotinovorans]SCZ59149.1 hypothetical protein SAMN02799638_02659 [Arthrobacter sp. UNCCL28]